MECIGGIWMDLGRVRLGKVEVYNKVVRLEPPDSRGKYVVLAGNEGYLK